MTRYVLMLGMVSRSFGDVEQSLSKVEETYEMFDSITLAADGAISVQEGISMVIDNSNAALKTLNDFFDNMLSQISPIIEDYTNG